MKTCRQCGFHHAETDRRCVRCGALLDIPSDIDPLRGPAGDLPAAPKRAPLRNAAASLAGGLRHAWRRILGRLLDPYPADALPRSPWLAGLRSLAIPGWGQWHNEQPRKGLWFLLGWALCLGAAVATWFHPDSNLVLLGCVGYLALAFHDAFVLAVRIRLHGEPIPWTRHIAYYAAWIFYFGFGAWVLIVVASWLGLQRMHVYHNELSPWLRQGESALIDRASLLWHRPQVGDVVLYDPEPIVMELPSSLESTRAVINPSMMVERIVATGGDTYAYDGTRFTRNGRPATAAEQPLRRVDLRPFSVKVPAGRELILFSYTGEGPDLFSLLLWGKMRGESPPLSAPGWIVTGWEAACMVKPEQILGRPRLVYNPPPARRILD